MKKIYNVIFATAALLAVSQMAGAQTYGQWSINGQIQDPKTHAILQWPKDNGVQLPENADFGYSKNISSPQTNGNYWIKLESFATGSATYVESAVPADIVLVLDVSSSMYADRGTKKDYYLDVNFVNNNVRDNNNLLYFSYKNLHSDEGNFYYLPVGAENIASNRRPLFTEVTGTGNNSRYFAYYLDADGTTRHYLNADGSVVTPAGTRPSGARNNSTTLFTGTLVHYRNQQRIDALKNAVNAFIDVIDHNDQYEDDTNDHPRSGGRLGNRISIITFASANNVTVQNRLDLGSLGQGKAAALKETVNGFRLYQGTRQDEGLKAANLQFENYVDAARMKVSTRTIVLFTDGDPYAGNLTDTQIYNYGLTAALKAKSEDDPETTEYEGYDATVFTVGLFSQTYGENTDIWKFMNYASSNAPKATSMSTPGTGFNKNAGYYKDATSETVDLTAVFSEIAHQSGGSTTALNASSANVDVISNSFILPAGTNTENIASVVKIFVAKLQKIENGKYIFHEEYLKGHAPDDYTYYELNDKGERISDTPKKVDANISVTLSGEREIKVKGFDYSSCFCGPVVNGNTTTYQGYKIIIMIPIKMNPDAVGGPNVETNGSGSGIFITDGDASAFVPYKSPTVSLPVNIHITKTGLEAGESAKFKIERAVLPEGDNVDASALTDWTYVSTVFVTRRQGQTTEPIVKVRGLPANVEVTTGEGDSATTEQKNVVYRITEEKWSWSYEAKTAPQYTNTKSITNPFTFDNEKKDRIDVLLRHAESKATNIFKPNVETNNVRYDDSKTNSR